MTVTVLEARALAARWTAGHREELPSFAGAFSAARRPGGRATPTCPPPPTSTSLTRERVDEHLRAMAAAFDAAAAAARTPFPFASDVTSAARPIAVDGSRALVGQDRHREAVFWIVATYARCQKLLAADAPPATLARGSAGFRELLGDLGLGSPADLRRRARDVRGFLPRLGEVKEAILAANPGIDG